MKTTVAFGIALLTFAVGLNDVQGCKRNRIAGCVPEKQALADYQWYFCARNISGGNSFPVGPYSDSNMCEVAMKRYEADHYLCKGPIPVQAGSTLSCD